MIDIFIISFALFFVCLFLSWLALKLLRDRYWNKAVKSMIKAQDKLLIHLDHIISWKYVNYINKKLFVLGYKEHGVIIYLMQIVIAVFLLPLSYFLLESIYTQLVFIIFSLLLVAVLPIGYVHQLLAQQKKGFLTAFGFFLDLLRLSLTSGASLNQSLKLSACVDMNAFLLKHIQQLIEDLEQGSGFAHAWSAFAQRCDESEVDAFVFAILQAHKQGMSLAAILEQQSQRIKTVLFIQAEKKALALPTKLIFPVLVFIFPTTFIVISFPLVLNLLSQW